IFHLFLPTIINKSVNYFKKDDMDELKPLILIAEDTEINFIYLNAILRNDFTIERAVDGQEALEKASANDYKVILMDIRMPRMDGIQSLKEIKKIKPEIPIVMQTAYALGNEIQDALDNGASGYLIKPMTKSDVMMKLKEVI